MTEHIEARTFRGTRKTSVYRSHPLDVVDLARITDAGRRSGLRVVPSLASIPCELDKENAGHLAAEVTELRMGAELLDLDDDLTALAELARTCSRARGGAWFALVAVG